jgi:GT2 family glycosyltransferase
LVVVTLINKILRLTQLFPLQFKMKVANSHPLIKKAHRAYVHFRDGVQSLKAYEQLLLRQDQEISRFVAENQPQNCRFVIVLADVRQTALVRQTLDSIEDQQYPDLLVALLGKENKSTAEIIDDKHYVTRFNQLHDLRQALDKAESSTSYVMFLEAGDRLSGDCLGYLSRVLNEFGQPNVVYTDHDHRDKFDKPVNPQLKPDWNPDYFLSVNYIGRSVLFNTRVLQTEYSVFMGIYDDVAFQLLASLFADEELDGAVVHIPLSLFQFPYLTENATKSLRLREAELTVSLIQPKLPISAFNISSEGIRSAQWELEQKPLVSIIIPTRNALEITQQCIDSIMNSAGYSNFEILLVDNQSDDPEALAYFQSISDAGIARVIKYDEPFNYSAINNFAVTHAKGEILLFLNNDIEVLSDDWLTQMVSNAARPNIGCVGTKLLYPNGQIQHAGVLIGYGGVADHCFKFSERDDEGFMSRLISNQNYQAVTAACMAIKKVKFLEVGGFEEENLQVAFNDVDLCLKVQQSGVRNLWLANVELLHYESLTRGSDSSGEGFERFQKEI